MTAATHPSLVLVVHALPPDEASGTPLVAHGYAAALAATGWDVTVLAMGPDAPPWDRLRAVRRPGEAFDRVPVRPVTQAGSVWTVDAPVQPLVATAHTAGRADPAEPAVAVAALLRQLSPDVVHVVDNVHLPLSIPEVAHRLGIPVVRTVSCAEDLCARIAPVSAHSGPAGFCPAPLTVDRCAGCVAATPDPAWRAFARTGDGELDARRHARLRHLLLAKRARAVHHFTEVYDRVVFASPRFRAYVEETLPLDPWRVRVVPMGVDLPAPAPATGGGQPDSRPGGGGQPDSRPGGSGQPDSSGQPGSEGGDPLRLLLAGTADPAKGIAAVVEVFTHPDLAGRHDWRLVLAGGGDRRCFGPLLDDARVTDHGPYAPSTLPALLADADVGLSTSVFETFHRVSREYLAAGLAVVGSAAFGITDVVEHGRNGLIFDHAEPGSLRRAITTLLDDRGLVARLRAGASATAVRTVAEEVEELQAVYRELVGVPVPA